MPEETNITEADVAEEFVSLMRQTIKPGVYGEVWCKVTFEDGKPRHIKVGVERNKKLRDLRT